jgi:hypothetical protein
MKYSKAARELVAAGSATKELLENVPEEWISAALYRKDEHGGYWINTVLDGVSTLSSLPGIPDGIGAAANDLKKSVDSLRKAIPPTKDESPVNRDTMIAQNPEFDGLAESVDRWQKLAGINKRVK